MTSLDQHTGVVGELARAHRRIAELERREALLTAVAAESLRRTQEWRAYMDGLGADRSSTNDHLEGLLDALTEAGFPWAPEAGE